MSSDKVTVRIPEELPVLMKKKFNCRGRAHTIGESVVKYIDHTHVPDITKIKYKEFVNEIKEVAKISQLTAHAVLGVVTAKTDINIVNQLPPINQLKCIVQRTRKQISSAPPNPTTLSDLSIPDEYKKSVCGEPFLLYDSFEENIDNKQILLFSTLKNLEILQNSYYWFADGTFLWGFHRFRQTFLYLGTRLIDSASIDSASAGSLKTTYRFRQGKIIFPDILVLFYLQSYRYYKYYMKYLYKIVIAN
ncbi:uncharacterized protein LOC112692785 [Sipha flava]|uniref:Uncharacterized protein LOC112692785 n=1 Tax=Sipha flava TaxID=143950 RepID=A0A8B8GLS2_9HEMI|nr:uncharacterized protein LOC112692785 [Sipha flava]